MVLLVSVGARTRGLADPFGLRLQVSVGGGLCFGSPKINLTTVFAGQNVHVKEVDEDVC